MDRLNSLVEDLDSSLDELNDSGIEVTPQKSGKDDRSDDYGVSDNENYDPVNGDFLIADVTRIVKKKLVLTEHVLVEDENASVNIESSLQVVRTVVEKEKSEAVVQEVATDNCVKEAAIQELTSGEKNAGIEAPVSPPQPPPEENHLNQEDLVNKHQEQVLKLVFDHRITKEGKETLTENGWELVKEYFNPKGKELSFLNTAVLENKLFAHVVEEFYGKNYAHLPRVLRSSAKFPLGNTPMIRNLIGAYFNCEHIGSATVHGEGKRLALLLLTKVFKADIITILEIKGCDWKNSMFEGILDGYEYVELPSHSKTGKNKRMYHCRGIALLVRAEIKDSLVIHSGYDKDCKKQKKGKPKDYEFLCVDMMVQGLTYRQFFFYHAPHQAQSCITNFVEVIGAAANPKEYRVDSFLALGDINIKPEDLDGTFIKLIDREVCAKYSLHRVLPTGCHTFERFDNATGNCLKKSQLDIILSRLGLGEQLFHKPIHLFSMVRGFANLNPEEDLHMTREEHAAIFKTLEERLAAYGAKLETYQGQGDSHHVFLYELGINVGKSYPFSTIFKRKSAVDEASEDQGTSSHSSGADEVEKLDALGQNLRPCGKNCILQIFLPYIRHSEADASGSQAQTGSSHCFCCQYP